jgi:hypothetical protein
VAPTQLPFLPMRAAGPRDFVREPGSERPFSDPVHQCEPVIISRALAPARVAPSGGAQTCAGFKSAPSGVTSLSTYRHRAMSSFRASAAILVDIT